MNIKPYVLDEKEHLIALRRYFHAHPEPSLKEFHTAEKIEQELDACGIKHQRIGESGVYACIKGKKGMGHVIALRCDIDALAMDDLKDEDYRSVNKGCAHACGHDAHTAVLLTVAKILKAKENEFSGEVRCFFQQAEEIGQGARQFVDAGLLEGVDRVYGAHMCSGLDVGDVSLTPGPMNASCDYFKIEVKGKGAHVSTPQLGIDALYIASQIVVNLQTIVSRNTAPVDSAVVGVGVLRAGTQYNIVAEDAVLEGTTRSFTPQQRAFTNQKVETIATQTAALFGASATVTFKDYAAPLINDEDVANEVSKIAEAIVGPSHVIHNQTKMLQADDFADYLAKVKGVYAFIGSRNKAYPNTCVALHHGLFDIDEDALLISCNLFVDYTLDYLK